MSHVLEYTVVAGASAYKSSGTSHKDALNRFIADPPATIGYHKGSYEVTDGEQIVVVGFTQDDYRAWWSHNQSLRLLSAAVEEGGPGIRERKRRLREAEKRNVPPPQPVSITFTMRERTVFDALTPEQVEREQEIPEMEERIREASRAGLVRLVCNTKRQLGGGDDPLVGPVAEIDHRGVRLGPDMRLIPWDDIDGVIALLDDEESELAREKILDRHVDFDGYETDEI